jgi:hypothetical protein
MPLNIELDKKLMGLLAGFVCYGLSASVAHAVIINEIGDAGETLATAQDTTGTGAVLDSISGALEDLGDVLGPDDIDLYKISIFNPGDFSVMVDAALTDPNDPDLWLFNTLGEVVLYDDCNESSPDCIPSTMPEFAAGDLSGDSGVYFLGISLFYSNPDNIDDPQTLATGWFRDPLPSFQTGPYTLSLTGVETAPRAVPEPGTLALFGLGLAGMGLARRRMKA